MKTRDVILSALHSVIDPTVDDLEARVAAQGFVCCHALTVRAGAARAADFADWLAYLVREVSGIQASMEGTRGEYRRYLQDRANEARQRLFAAVSGDAEMVTAMGHDLHPVEMVLENLIGGKA